MTGHRLDLRVYYEDTDAGGVMYHARYLAFAERARTEMMRSLGVTHEQMKREDGLIFVVRRVKMDYLRPARLDDVVSVVTEAVDMSAATVSLRQDFATGGAVLARLDIQLACIRGADGRPWRIPARVRAAMEETRREPS